MCICIKKYYRFAQYQVNEITCIGIRKKRAAPPPPTPRPLSSAISTQALERIVDSEESLTSDMDPSKPPSDIGAPSKASSDIDCPKANSDINISTQSMRQLDCKVKPETATCEFNCNIQQNCAAEENTEARSKSDLISSELVKAEVIAPVEATLRVEQARITAKRGKLAHTANNLNASLYDSKTQNFPGNLQVGEGTNIEEKTSHVTLHPRKHRYSERNKLHVTIQKYRSQYDNSTSINFANNVSVGIAKNHIEDVTGQRSQICQNSQSLRGIKSNSHEYRGGTIPFDNELLANRSNKSANYAKHYMKKHDHMSKQLTRIQTSVNLDGIKSNVENMECKILKSKYNPKLSHNSSYVCRGKYGKRVSSCSFQNSMTSRATKLWNSSEKPSLMQNLLKHSKPLNSLEFPSYLPKVGRINTTRYASFIANENRESRNCSKQYAENNSYPPPLSTLQIFAISTKPVDIQVVPTESIPSDIDELPSLPIINYTENKLQERKLSILEPPPSGLINRQESNENWNRFLVQLNSILENRVGEFV